MTTYSKQLAALGIVTATFMAGAALPQDAALAPGVIERVEAVGSTDSLPFKRTPQALEVKLPEGLGGTPAVELKVRGPSLA
ncbi:MAG: hypothetical protein JF607_29140 [Burkholderiales bacterium]|nr:hypothetical protein [Burkholderiales bacterium]MBW8894164.1 hypothetical protein [Burkholderiales bacterium]